VEAAVMILTDDNFGGMFGYIATFLGASIFDIARGVPLRGGRRGRKAMLRRTAAKATRPADGLFLAMPVSR
jgi:hypothetical protein